MTEQPPKKKRILIDGTTLVIASHYAASKFYKELETDRGVLLGFLIKIRSACLYHNTSDVIIGWTSDTSKRQEIYPPYRQIPTHTNETIKWCYQFASEIQKILITMGFKNQYKMQGLEGADVLGHFSRLENNKENIILTSDANLLSLLSNHTSVQYFCNTYESKVPKIVKKIHFINQFEITPDQWPLIKAMAGDSWAHVPGVKGIGKNTAIKYAMNEPISALNKAKIRNDWELIELFQKLFTYPVIPLNLPDPERNPYCADGILEMFNKHHMEAELPKSFWNDIVEGKL